MIRDEIELFGFHEGMCAFKKRLFYRRRIGLAVIYGVGRRSNKVVALMGDSENP